jgi:hypothetical protein
MCTRLLVPLGGSGFAEAAQPLAAAGAPRRRLLAAALLALAPLVAPVTPAAAQSAWELTLDVRPWSAELGVARSVSRASLAGFSVGLGAKEELNRTLAPEIDASPHLIPLEQVVRLGPFIRYRAAPRVDIDAGARLALASIYLHGDTPNLLVGAHAGVFVGGRHVRAGPRLVIGRIDAGLERHTVVHLDYVTVRGRVGF